jgi:putative ABC transport system ATP-binding protein
VTPTRREAGRLVVDARGVTKAYRRGPEEVLALRGATFAVRAGEVVALRGPSGSGKTTLLNVVAGWEAPDAGELRVDVDVAPHGVPWSNVALVPQRLGLLDELTIAENVALPMRLRPSGYDDPGRVERTMSELGLDELADRSPAETSLGQQQRTAVARALVLGPDLVLADEPTGHQDEAWAVAVLAALHAAATERGTACIVATHSDEVAAAADRLLRMEDGRIAAEG